MENPAPDDGPSETQRAFLQGLCASLNGQLQVLAAHAGPHTLLILAGTIARVFEPMRDGLRQYDRDAVPPHIAKFYDGISAVIEDVISKRPAIISPNDAES